jgi:hypothetical protein
MLVERLIAKVLVKPPELGWLECRAGHGLVGDFAIFVKVYRAHGAC